MASTTAQAHIDEMLDVYIHDYLVKRKLHNSAKSFMTAAKVSPDPIAIDAPEGFLCEWWCVFWDIFISRTNDKHFESASAYIQAQQTKAREQQLQMQNLQLMRHRNAQLKRRHPNHSALGDSINGMNSKGMTHSNSMDSRASPTLIYANRVVLPKSATSHQGQLNHGNSGNISTALEQIQAQPSGLNQGNTSLQRKGLPLIQQALAQAHAQNLGDSTKCDMDPHRLSDLGRGSLSAKDGQAARNDRSTFQAQQTKAREQQLQMQQLQLMQHHSAQLKRRHPNHSALEDSINGTNSKGMTHSNSMDLGASPTLIYANRAALTKSTSHRGQLVHGNSGNVSTALEQIQVQPLGLNQGNTSLPLKGSPLIEIDQLGPTLGGQVQKPNLTNQNQSLLVSQQQQALAQAQNNLGNSTKCDMDPHRLSDLGRGSLSSKDCQAARNDRSICTQVLSGSPQNKRERKHHSSSGSANSTGTGNAVGPSPNSPPSTPTPRDGIDTTSSMQHVDSVQVSMMMNGIEETGSLASSPLSLDHLELFADFDFFDKQFGDIDTLGFDV